MTAIWGSRQKAKLALKRNLPPPKTENNCTALSTVVQRNEGVADARPLAVSGGTSPNTKEQISRLQNSKLNISATYSLQKINGLQFLVGTIFFLNSKWTNIV